MKKPHLLGFFLFKKMFWYERASPEKLYGLQGFSFFPPCYIMVFKVSEFPFKHLRFYPYFFAAAVQSQQSPSFTEIKSFKALNLALGIYSAADLCNVCCCHCIV